MDWTNWINKAESMIRSKGFDIRLIVGVNTTYVPATDSYTAATVGYGTKAIFTALEDFDDAGHITKIENGAVLIPAKGLPRIDDVADLMLVIGTKIYTSPKVVTIQPGGEALAYKVRIL